MVFHLVEMCTLLEYLEIGGQQAVRDNFYTGFSASVQFVSDKTSRVIVLQKDQEYS